MWPLTILDKHLFLAADSCRDHVLLSKVIMDRGCGCILFFSLLEGLTTVLWMYFRKTNSFPIYTQWILWPCASYSLVARSLVIKSQSHGHKKKKKPVLARSVSLSVNANRADWFYVAEVSHNGSCCWFLLPKPMQVVGLKCSSMTNKKKQAAPTGEFAAGRRCNYM